MKEAKLQEYECTLNEQAQLIAKQNKEMQGAKRSAQYRHKKNLEQELILQHREENLRLRQQQQSELPDLSYCKFGRKEGHVPPKKEEGPRLNMRREDIGREHISPIPRQTSTLHQSGIPEANRTLHMEDPDNYEDWDPGYQQMQQSQHTPYEPTESMRMPRQLPLDSAWETSTAP